MSTRYIRHIHIQARELWLHHLPPASCLFFAINAPGQRDTTIPYFSCAVFTHKLRAVLTLDRAITSIAENLITALYAAFLLAVQAPLFPTFTPH